MREHIPPKTHRHLGCQFTAIPAHQYSGGRSQQFLKKDTIGRLLSGRMSLGRRLKSSREAVTKTDDDWKHFTLLRSIGQVYISGPRRRNAGPSDSGPAISENRDFL